jgi:hypothetical protein
MELPLQGLGTTMGLGKDATEEAILTRIDECTRTIERIVSDLGAPGGVWPETPKQWVADQKKRAAKLVWPGRHAGKRSRSQGVGGSATPDDEASSPSKNLRPRTGSSESSPAKH